MESSSEEDTQIPKRKNWAVVSFIKEKKNGKILIEIVPFSWLKTDQEPWLCFYPATNAIASTAIKSRQPPAADWKLYPVNLIKDAETYDQGMRRLNRAYKESEIFSTEAEDHSNVSQEETDENVSDDVSSSTSPPRKKLNSTLSQQKSTRQDTTNISDAESHTVPRGDESSNKNLSKRKRKTSERDDRSSDKFLLREIKLRLDESDRKNEKFHNRLAKQIKGAKRSIMYDFEKKFEALQNTAVLSQGRGPGSTLKKNKETLGIKLPIDSLNTFISFEELIKDNEEKETALKEIMVNSVGTATEVKEAVRKILGSLLMKAVQELYSGTGRKGPNGVTKKNFSATHMFLCMKDVITEKLSATDEKKIISATSRYLSGAGDREGGKAERDAKKNA